MLCFGSVLVRLTEPLGSDEPPNLTEPVSSAEPKPEPERFGLPLDEVYSCSSIAPLESPKFAGHHHQTLDSYTILFSIFPNLGQFYSSRIILLFWNICVICTKPYNLQP